MGQNNKDVVLPSDAEKLSHKYILDALKKKVFQEPSEAEPVRECLPEAPKEALPEDQCGTEAPVEVSPPQPDLPGLSLPPSQRYFRVNEVAKAIGVETHVLRYWQSEFSIVRPKKSANGHWVYSRQDVEAFHQIRHLLYVEKFSVQGAKKRLRDQKRGKVPTPPSPLKAETLKFVAKELKELIQLARNAQVY
jgi:DNA-binding transcriptional MerR regulator